MFGDRAVFVPSDESDQIASASSSRQEPTRPANPSSTASRQFDYHGDAEIFKGFPTDKDQYILRPTIPSPFSTDFDDTLSAVDFKTREAISQRLLGPQGLLKKAGTTVVMASNDGEPILCL